MENGGTFFFANTHFPSSALQAINGKPVPGLTVQERIEINLLDATVPQALKFDGGGWLDNQRIPGAGEILAATLQDIAGGAPLVLTGDFNMTSNAFAYDILTGASGSEYVSGFGLTDTYAEIFGPASTLTSGHGTLAFDPDEERAFGTNPKTSRGRIDYIFASKDFEVVSSEIERDRYFITDCDSGEVCWKYASDHYPVTSVIELADADNGGGGNPPGEAPPTTQVPLPAGAWLLLTGLAGLAAASRRRAYAGAGAGHVTKCLLHSVECAAGLRAPLHLRP
ncbi:MAG: endonuclease/exonuclease/phosphatase family protein [Pseudomonadota bacterium]